MTLIGSACWKHSSHSVPLPGVRTLPSGEVEDFDATTVLAYSQVRSVQAQSTVLASRRNGLIQLPGGCVPDVHAVVEPCAEFIERAHVEVLNNSGHDFNHPVRLSCGELDAGCCPSHASAGFESALVSESVVDASVESGHRRLLGCSVK